MKNSPAHKHTRQSIRQRLRAKPRYSYLRDFVYGGIDGAVTTFAVVSGVAGAQLSPKIVMILGVANLIADGFSMAASNYLGTRAEKGEITKLRKIEEEHIRRYPDGEREEVRQIYASKGFDGPELEHIVKTITSDKERWITTMLSAEYNVPSSIRSPWNAGLSTFVAFLLCGAVPLLPYALGTSAPFLLACGFTGVVFTAIGSAKSAWLLTPWWRSALQTLAIGSVAAVLAYGVGALSRVFV